MVRPDIVTLVNRETQTSSAAVFKKDLPKAGGISAIDLGFRITNGATAPANKDILDVLEKIELIFNGTDRRLSLTGQEMFRMNWFNFGKPRPYTFDETASAVQEVWLRYCAGRHVGDPQYGIDLSRFNNVQLNIDYDMEQMGILDTHVDADSFTPTVLLHMFQPGQVPSFRGMIGQREIWNYTTLGGGINKDVDLPSTHPIKGVGIFAMEDAVAEATDITDIIIGKDQFRTRWVDGKWYNLQPICNNNLLQHALTYKVYPTAAASKYLHVANIKQQIFNALQLTPSATVSDAVNVLGANDPTGNSVTFAGTTITVDTDATPTVVGKAITTGTEAWLTAIGDIHGALYFPFGKPDDNFMDALTPADLQSAQVRLVDGGAGAYAAVVVEEIYT